MAVEYRREDDTYFTRRRIDNQTIELGINFIEETDKKSYWNIYVTIFNKRKDMYTNMDKKIITGKNPFKTALAARDMFYEVEAAVLDGELVNGPYDEVAIFCIDMAMIGAYMIMKSVLYEIIHLLM